MKTEQELINESRKGFVRRDLVDLYQRFIGERSGGKVHNSSLDNDVNVSERFLNRQKRRGLNY